VISSSTANAESGDQLGIRAAVVDISLFRFTKIFLSADDVPHECRRRRRERKAKLTGGQRSCSPVSLSELFGALFRMA